MLKNIGACGGWVAAMICQPRDSITLYVAARLCMAVSDWHGRRSALICILRNCESRMLDVSVIRQVRVLVEALPAMAQQEIFEDLAACFGSFEEIFCLSLTMQRFPALKATSMKCRSLDAIYALWFVFNKVKDLEITPACAIEGIIDNLPVKTWWVSRLDPLARVLSQPPFCDSELLTRIPSSTYWLPRDHSVASFSANSR